MKKLLILFAAVILAGCTCTMSQTIPAQVIYVDANCQGVLPNFIPLFTYTDNCRIDTVFQNPEPGYILSAGENSVNVQIIAVDAFLNNVTIIFPCTLKDTIKPQISYNNIVVSNALGDPIWLPGK